MDSVSGPLMGCADDDPIFQPCPHLLEWGDSLIPPRGKPSGQLCYDPVMSSLPSADLEARVVELERRLEEEREARRSAEATLQSQSTARDQGEEQLRSLFENALIGIYRTTPDGQVLMVNSAQAQIWGFSSVAEVMQSNLEQITQDWGYDRSEFKRRMEREDTVQGIEATWTRPDGSRIWVRESSRAVRGPEGEVLYYEGTVEDITERQRAAEAAERLRVERAALERSNRELEQFAFVASHDLQEPLRKVQTFGDLLRKRCGEALDGRGRDYLDRMQGAARRMQGLITDLLAYSRVGTTEAHLVPVSLENVVHEVLGDLEVVISQAEARIQVGDLPTLEADARQMQQLLQNLLANALKFHRPGIPPKVQIEATVERRSDGAEICRLILRDNGIGFDEHHRQTIFQPFKRLHGRGEYEGTGIGLAICQRIVARHGGTIDVESRVGQGSSFRIDLPLVQPSL